MAAIERERGGRDPVPPAVANGWQVMAKRHPRQSEILLDLARDPSPLVNALSVGLRRRSFTATGSSGNLDRPIRLLLLLDWGSLQAQGAPLVDVAWYLAVTCDRLPESKEDTLATYRRALEAAGVDTSSWWAAQLRLRTRRAETFLQLGWSKNEDDAEFGWWSDRLDEALQIS